MTNQVSPRLELAHYCLHRRILVGGDKPAAQAAAAGAGQDKKTDVVPSPRAHFRTSLQSSSIDLFLRLDLFVAC